MSRRTGAAGSRRSAKRPTRRAGSRRRTTTTTAKRRRTAAPARARRPRQSTEKTTPEGLITTDHDRIRQWVEERGGQPACVRGTGDADDVGLLRIDFPGYTGAESLQPISWDEFFDKFDQRKLAFLHRQQSHDGGQSYFNKLIDRPTRRSGGRGR
jgi:hypothetical protein